MPSASEIVLQYVMPALGMVTANFMFSGKLAIANHIHSPVKDARRAASRGTLGSLNPTPWAFMTGNCLGWVTYSYLIQNQFVFWANAPGLIISVWLNLCGAKLQYSDRISASMRSSFVDLLDRNRRSFALAPGERRVLGGDLNKEEEEDTGGIQNGLSSGVQTFANLKKTALEITIQKTEAPAPHEKVVVFVVTFWVAVISLCSFLKLSIDMWQMVVGIVVNVNLLFFYGAPLSTIVTVLKTRDSSSIHQWTMLMNTANAIFWTAFGFGVMDWYILVPNGIGAILGFVQIFLRAVVPSHDPISSSSGPEDEDAELPGGVADRDIEATASASTQSGS